MTPTAAIFQRNLRHAAMLLDIHDHNQLADKLGWKDNDRRWLRRIWDQGLDRPDKRRTKDIKQLGKLLGVQPDDLWRPDIEIRGTDVVHDPERWEKLVRSVIEIYLRFQVVKRQQHDWTVRALSRYRGDEELLIAELVAQKHGVDSPKLARIRESEMEKLGRSSPEWRALTNEARKGEDALYEFVGKQIRKHPWFKPFEEEIVSEQGANAETAIKNLIRQIWQRPKTPQEVVDEFVSLHLDSFTEDDGFDEAMKVIERELRHLWRITAESGGAEPKAFGKAVKKLLNSQSRQTPWAEQAKKDD